MSNHICNSQSSSFTEAAYELGTSASEAFDTGNSSGLGQGLEIDNAGFFSTTRSGTSSQSSFRNMNENEVNAAAAASFASMSSQGSVSAVTNVYEPQDEYPNSAYVPPPFSRSPMSTTNSFTQSSSRGSINPNIGYSIQQNACNQSANSNPFDMSASSLSSSSSSSSAGSNQFRPASSVSNLSIGSKKCSQQQAQSSASSMTTSHGYDLVASDVFRATLTTTNVGYSNGLSYSKTPVNSSILEEPECMSSQMWSQDCDHHHHLHHQHQVSGSSAPSTASSYGFSPYTPQPPQPNYSNTILGSASIYTKTPSTSSSSVVNPTSGARVSFAAYANSAYGTSSQHSTNSHSSQQIPTAANNYIGTITGSISPYNAKSMTPVMSSNQNQLSNSNSFSASGYGGKPQTPIGSNSIYSTSKPGNCGLSSPSGYGFVAYGSTSGSSSQPMPCSSAASASIYNSKPSTPSQDPDCSASQIWSSGVASDCNGSQQTAPQSPFRPGTSLSNSNKCPGSVYSKPPSPQNDPDCSQSSASSSQLWASDCAGSGNASSNSSQQIQAPCSNSASASMNISGSSQNARGSAPAVNTRASIGSLRASFSVSQIPASQQPQSAVSNQAARASNVSFGVTSLSNGFGGSTSALYSNSNQNKSQDCRQQSLASQSSANFNAYETTQSNTFGNGSGMISAMSGSARASGQSARVSFASFNDLNASQQQQQQQSPIGYSTAQSASIYMKPQSTMSSTSQVGFNTQSASVLYGSNSNNNNSKTVSGSASIRTPGSGSARPSAIFGSGSNSASARLSSASFVAGSSKPIGGSSSIIASGSLYLSGSGLSTSTNGVNKQRSLFSSGSSSSLASNSGSMNQSGSGSAILSTSGSTRQSVSNLFASAGSGSSILSASAPAPTASTTSASASGSASIRQSGSGSVAPASSRLSSASFALTSSASNAPCSQSATLSASNSNVAYSNTFNSTYKTTNSTYNQDAYNRSSLSGSIISIGLSRNQANSSNSASVSASLNNSMTQQQQQSGRCSASLSQQQALNDNTTASLKLSPTKSQSSYNNCKPQPPSGSAQVSNPCKQSQTPPPCSQSPQQQQQPPCSQSQQQGFESKIEKAILSSTEPIQITETQEISALGNRGIWANRCEVCTWKGDLPISEYPINEDACPEIINKKSQQRLQYNQEIAIRYLKPPAPPAPGDIIIKQEPNQLPAPAPPIVIRQQPARPCTPEPLVIREAPPQPPPCIGQQIITISGRRLPAPPRKVVIERMAPIPSKPQSVLIERWMPYAQAKRKVIFQAAPPDPVVINPRNIIVQWEAPEVCVKKDIRHLGIICANPCDYAARYGSSMKKPCELPKFVLDIKPQCGVELAANKPTCQVPELEGDIEALKLIDLDKEGLGMYKKYLNQNGNNCNNSNSNNNNNSANGDCENRYSLSESMMTPPYSPVNNSSSSQTNSQNNSSSSTTSSSPMSVNTRYTPQNAYSTAQNCY